MDNEACLLFAEGFRSKRTTPLIRVVVLGDEAVAAVVAAIELEIAAPDRTVRLKMENSRPAMDTEGTVTVNHLWV